MFSAAGRAPVKPRRGARELRWMTRVVGGCLWRARVATAPRCGDDVPVVFVHGFGVSSSYFVPLAERLAARLDVYAPDLPGHGKSATPRRPLGLRSLAGALHDWLSAMRIEHAGIVAHSMGCQIAAELAARHARLVSRVVMIGPTLDRDARSLRRVLPRFFAGGLHERPSITPLLVRDYWHMRARLPAEFRAMVAHRIEDVLPQVKAPVLFVRGEHDAIAPRRWLDELVALTPGARLAAIRGGGHAVHFARPDETLNVVLPFLRADETRRRASAGMKSSVA